MTTITVSIPTDCLTYISEGGVPSSVDTSRKEKVKVDKARRRPNHQFWGNKKEYQAWWYQQNRDVYKARILKRYHEKKKLASKNGD